MSYDLGVLNLSGGKKKSRTWMYVVVAVVVVVVVVVAASLRGFDENLERAAQNLGANRWHTFRLVTLPLIRPGVISAMLLAFITSFDEIVKLRGIPSARLRPFTSISRTSEPGNAEPISFLIISAVASPISIP